MEKKPQILDRARPFSTVSYIGEPKRGEIRPSFKQDGKLFDGRGFCIGEDPQAVEAAKQKAKRAKEAEKIRAASKERNSHVRAVQARVEETGSAASEDKRRALLRATGLVDPGEGSRDAARENAAVDAVEAENAQ